MKNYGTDERGGQPVAIVGMACRYPDADSPAQLWQMVLDQRQAFRRIPTERLNLRDYHDPDPTVPDKTYSSKAALLEGWQFDRAAFRIPGTTYRSADPTHWLALETASRALADAGYVNGRGLNKDKVAVVMGNSLTGEVTRATTLRLRLPYARGVLESAAHDVGLSSAQIDSLLDQFSANYLAPFPPVGDETLVGGLSNTIAGRVCNYFDFHGGGYTVDGACASSLLAVITACRALVDGSVDAALAGGVDLSIDPFELVGFAKTGALAADRMRVYDQRSSGFLPGEGCGVVLLMRAADAHAAGLPIYAEITGWGISSDGKGGITRPERQGQLLALRRAYELAGIAPTDVELIEGHGTGTAVGDDVELSALAELRGGGKPAAIGSVKANIGHTKAAAGAAGLIKATLAVASAVLPPTTGCDRPQSVLLADNSPLRVLSNPEPWPAATRIAGVSAMGFGGINAHITLRSPQLARPRVIVAPPPRPHRAAPQNEVFALGANSVQELRTLLHRIAALAPRLSEAEVHDLACQLGRSASGADPLRVAFVAATPDQLAHRATVATTKLADVRPGQLTATGGVYVGAGVAGRVTLLLPGQGAPVRSALGALGRELTSVGEHLPWLEEPSSGHGTASAQPAIYRATMAALRWLARLDVKPAAVIGHSLGEIAGLVWAGCMSYEDGYRLLVQRGGIMQTRGRAGTTMLSVATDATSARRLCDGTHVVVAGYNGPRSHVLAGANTEISTVALRASREGISTTVLPVSHAFHSPAMADCVTEFAAVVQAVSLDAPHKRVVSSVRGRALTEQDDIAELLTEQITAPVLFWDAVTETLPDTDLYCEVGPGRTLSALIAAGCDTPVVAVDAGSPDDRPMAETIAALFAAGAVPELAPAFVDRSARSIDIWRDRVFLANPCAMVTSSRQPSVTSAPPIVPIDVMPDQTVESVVINLVAEASELDASAISPHMRLMSDLHLTSLRVTQLTVAAARAAGRTRPIEPMAIIDASVSELTAMIEELPVASEKSPDIVVAGVGSWTACFVEERQHRILAASQWRSRGWRAHIASGHPLSEDANRTLATRGDDQRVPELAYVPEATTAESLTVLLTAVRSAIRSKALVVVAHDFSLSGFLRTVRHEHPDVGVTLLVVPPTVNGLGIAAAHAKAEPGTWQELELNEDGHATERVSRPLRQTGSGALPLGPRDVVLVSGGGKGIGYECAAALARASGASLALLGRTKPGEDEELRRRLAALKGEGIRLAYESIDVADAIAVAAGVARLTAQLGPITSLLHASGINEPARLMDLDQARITAHLEPKITGLRNLIAALEPRHLRLVITFGSVIGRYGLAGESHYALANGALCAEVDRLNHKFPTCRVLNLEWSIWAGTGMGERLGVLDSLRQMDVAAVSVEEGTELFLKLLRTTDLPTTVAVHGRLGTQCHTDVERPAGRFMERVRVYYPGVELVAEADLDLQRDAYLGDHRIDGLAVMPAVMGLEAMAQAASAVAGRPLRYSANGRFDRPVIVPEVGARTIRVCALLRNDVVEVALRSDETEYTVDHFRATFPLAQPAQTIALPDLPELDTSLGSAAFYGPIAFHTGSFKLVEEFTALGARHCQVRLAALGADADRRETRDAPLLGNLISNDATVHALQACVPHRRLLPVAYDRFTVVSGAGAPRELFAVERHASGGEYTWDVVAIDRNRKRVISWTGLRLRDVGPLPGAGVWPRQLLEVYLERSAITLGLRPDVRVHVTTADRQLVGAAVRRDGGNHRGPGLAIEASGAVCDWQPILDDSESAPPPGFEELCDQLSTILDEPMRMACARVRTIAECLSQYDMPAAPVTLKGAFDGGWVLLRSGSTSIASTVVTIAEEDGPVAVAILSAEPEGASA